MDINNLNYTELLKLQDEVGNLISDRSIAFSQKAQEIVRVGDNVVMDHYGKYQTGKVDDLLGNSISVNGTEKIIWYHHDIKEIKRNGIVLFDRDNIK